MSHHCLSITSSDTGACRRNVQTALREQYPPVSRINVHALNGDRDAVGRLPSLQKQMKQLAISNDSQDSVFTRWGCGEVVKITITTF